MNTSVVVNEFAKMRRLRIGLITVAMVVAVVGLSVASAATSPDFADPGTRSRVLLAGMSLAFPFASPLLLAVLASRQVDIEHQGNGWLFFHTSGITPGRLIRAKFLVSGVNVVLATGLQSVAVLGIGLALGASPPGPLGLWAGYTLSVLVVNLVLLAVHLVIAARVENQLVGLGIGVLGTLGAVFATGMPSAVAHLTPWGYYSLAAAADYQGQGIILLTPAYPSIAALGVIAAGAFLFTTALFDSREA